MADYDTFKKAAIRGQDEIVACPYNPSHQINKSRMQYHIVKCAKQHAQRELETCPFNTTHRIPKPEMQMHILECPDRRILEGHKFQSGDECPDSGMNVPNFVQPSLPPSQENWDDEDYQSTYDPEKHINNKCVIRNIQGATKSERKQFRLGERRRVNQLCSETSTSEVSDLTKVPPRPPKSLPRGITNTEFAARLGMGRGLLPSNSGRNPGMSEPIGKNNSDETNVNF